MPAFTKSRFVIFAMLMALNWQGALAAPAAEANPALVIRAPGDSAQNPITADIGCSGIEDICEADCIAILCHNRPQVM
jgi:hypothetical protein